MDMSDEGFEVMEDTKEKRNKENRFTTKRQKEREEEMEAEERSKPKKQGATMAELGSVKKAAEEKGTGAITGPAPWPAAGGKHEYVDTHP